MKTGGRYIFRTEAEALSKTGFFSIESVKITAPLGGLIEAYITDAKLATHRGVNQAHTSTNTYTAQFCLKQYNVLDNKTQERKQFAYIDGTIAWGHLYQYGKDRHEAMRKKSEATPSLRQMYFWICRKYPQHVLWTNCSFEEGLLARLARTTSDESLNDLDF